MAFAVEKSSLEGRVIEMEAYRKKLEVEKDKAHSIRGG
jgi:hypothetical protein